MLSNWAVHVASRLIRGHFRQPIEYWRHRVWDGVLAEQHDTLGSAYRAERAAITRILKQVVPNRCILDVACGTGRYTFAALEAGAQHVTAMDVSAAALAELRERAKESGFESRVATLNADMWCESPICHCGRRFDVVMCLDAIHHLGSLPEVFTRLSSFVGSEGILIGDVWTLNSYGEFQRLRRSWIEHLMTSFVFITAVIWWRLWHGRIPNSVRSELREAKDVVSTLLKNFGPNVSIEIDRYWLRFATSSTSIKTSIGGDPA